MMARDIPALLAFLEEHQDTRHRWDAPFDCVTFALAAVWAQTGVDHLADIQDWSSRASALRVARGLGGLRKAMNDRFNQVAPALALRGDIAGLPDKAFGVSVAIVEGHTLVAPGDAGLVRLPRSRMTIAWSATP